MQLAFDIARIRAGRSRAINAENPTGTRAGGARATTGIGAHASRELGVGWKVSPAFPLDSGQTLTLAEIEGPGVITHIWMTCAPQAWRSVVLRVYWDDEETPSIETPLGDFFAQGWCRRTLITSVPIAALAGGGLNSYWPMPFRRSARVTVENLGVPIPQFFFQVDYSLEDQPDDVGYLHAQWRRSNPVEEGLYTILEGVRGRGHYVGTFMTWQANSNGWWGEGEVKFYLDGDAEHPTICGTGLEDYFGGAWAFEQEEGAGPDAYSSPFLGFAPVSAPNNTDTTNRRFGMYRWHLPDPIRFEEGLRVDVQALGWRSEQRYLVLKDDVSSVALWYQTEPHAPFPPLPGANDLEVI